MSSPRRDRCFRHFDFRWCHVRRRQFSKTHTPTSVPRPKGSESLPCSIPRREVCQNRGLPARVSCVRQALIDQRRVNRHSPAPAAKPETWQPHDGRESIGQKKARSAMCRRMWPAEKPARDSVETRGNDAELQSASGIAVLGAIALGATVLACGGADLNQLGARSAFDLDCPRSKIGMTQIDDRTVGVNGCGQLAVYIESCNKVGNSGVDGECT